MIARNPWNRPILISIGISRSIILAVVLTTGWAIAAQTVQPPKEPVPKSPYIAVVYRYADAMLDHARDTYGEQKTGLFLSALERTTLQPLTNCPPAPGTIRDQDRVRTKDGILRGIQPTHDENLLRLLYALTELTTKPKYREAADSELRWTIQHLPSLDPFTQICWDPVNDEFFPLEGTGQAFRPWMLWPRCHQLVPELIERMQKLSIPLGTPILKEGDDFSRTAGFCIRVRVSEYSRSPDQVSLGEIEHVLAQADQRRHLARSEWLLSLAIDCSGSSREIPEPLASRLEKFASELDQAFCKLPHELRNSGGFMLQGQKQATPRWGAQADGITTARIGMLCVSRYDNTGFVPYRKLVTGAADAYIDSLPGAGVDALPGTFGHAISLELAAWRHTAEWKYLTAARKLADFAVEKFWGTNALPRASLRTDHYESVTGGDTLALALLELHLQVLHITAIRCPPNTIDR